MDRNKLPFTEGEEVSHITCDLCTGMGYDLCIDSAFPDIFHQDKKREIGIEKMKINEEIYRSIIAPKEESDRNIVPLEEVLLIDEAAMRRDLIMNVLNDDPENYIDMLKQARMNDDVEVVHYAITGMVELSKEYESRLQKIEYRYAKEPENQQLISEYCDFLQEYLSQGLLEGQMDWCKEINI